MWDTPASTQLNTPVAHAPHPSPLLGPLGGAAFTFLSSTFAGCSMGPGAVCPSICGFS